MGHCCRLFIAFGLLTASLPDAAAAAAASPAVPVLTEIVAGSTERLPAQAAAGEVLEGLFNLQALDSSRLSVPLADGRTLEATRLQEFRGTRGDVTWSGELEDNPGSMVIFTAYDGAVTGFLHVEAEIWELTPTAQGRSVLYRVDESQLPEELEPPLPEFDGAGYDVADSGSVTAQLDASPAQPATHDVLVIYTAKAQSVAGSKANIESKIINAVGAANAAYINSRVGINLNLVGMAGTSYAETGDFGTSLSRVRGTSDGYMDDVHAERDRLAADMVVLISEDQTYCGIAYLMGAPSTSFAPAAFSVVKQSCFSNRSLAHELGHNQGNSHDRANGGAGSFPFSYGYRTCDNVAPTNGQSFRTVMAYPCSSSPRLNYFSNPDVFYNGAPMGVDYEQNPQNSSDNSRSMNQTAPYVADFRSPSASAPPTAPDKLVATASAWDKVALGWNDNAVDESGYTVQRSVSGGTFSDRATLPSNSTAFTDAGLTGSTSYTYRVRAYNSAGSSAYSNLASASTPSAPPPPTEPAPATVTPSSTQTALEWTNVDNETGYEVVRETYRSRKGTWSATSIQLSTDVNTLRETLSNGTYRYKVRAVGLSGSSAFVVGQCATCGTDGSFKIGNTTGTSK